MRCTKTLAVAAISICCLVATGKNKKKILLPADVLKAQTVLVLIDPDAGVPLDAPNANRTAQEDVEKALMNWGRFRLTMNLSNADLIILVRKGNGKIVEPTIGGVPINNRPVIAESSDSSVRMGGQRGNPSQAGNPNAPGSQGPHPQMEAGQAEDLFAVYRGGREDPLDASAVWRYSATDALRSPGVPAVDAFKKLVLEAEKQQANNP
jgi:hypothetical protein